MRLEIFEEKKVDDVLRLRLEHCSDDEGIKLVAVDESGKRLDRGSILRIRADGRVGLYSNIDASLGLKLDEQERIEVEKE